MRNLIAVGTALMLAGCAVGKDPSLAQYDGITYTKSSSGQEYITSAKFQFPGTEPKNKEALPLCIAKGVNAYPSTAQPIRFMADDKRRAVAEGGLRVYESTLGIPSETLVRYTLDASITPQGRSYLFEKMDQRLSGSPEMGFIPIGAWSGGSGIEIVESLHDLAGSIDSCLSQ
ncbi:hypothetical protein [Bordetella genomosp. 4]|uniref:Lipoprotein n=1 Tax=Bordetella genomosp. 4 TaxID=463044 RepID=A0A261U574_9BORD|nr:hypothetical protein [Bordetella genomosp. 4]OZI56765.1 hypothetical protein CAL20_15305 [Bordetella genomosp. 4]